MLCWLNHSPTEDLFKGAALEVVDLVEVVVRMMVLDVSFAGDLGLDDEQTTGAAVDQRKLRDRGVGLSTERVTHTTIAMVNVRMKNTIPTLLLLSVHGLPLIE